jgi:hypothetical protein
LPYGEPFEVIIIIIKWISFIPFNPPGLDKRACLCALNNASGLLTSFFLHLIIVGDLVNVERGLLIRWRYALIVGDVWIFGQHNRALNGPVITERLASWVRNGSHLGG